MLRACSAERSYAAPRACSRSLLLEESLSISRTVEMRRRPPGLALRLRSDARRGRRPTCSTMTRSASSERSGVCPLHTRWRALPFYSPNNAGSSVTLADEASRAIGDSTDALWIGRNMSEVAADDHAWIEVTHCETSLPSPFDPASERAPVWRRVLGPAWFYHAPGSGLSINIGRTIVGWAVSRVQERHDFLCRSVRVASRMVGKSGSVRTLACLCAWSGCHWAWEAHAHGPEHTSGAHPEHVRSTRGAPF